MADVYSKEIRSKNMAAIKSKDTKPEMLVRRFLHNMAIDTAYTKASPKKSGLK